MIRAPDGDPSPRPTRLWPQGGCGCSASLPEAGSAACRVPALPPLRSWSCWDSSLPGGSRWFEPPGTASSIWAKIHPELLPSLPTPRRDQPPGGWQRGGSSARDHPPRVAAGWPPEPRALIGPAIPSGIGPPGAGMMGASAPVVMNRRKENANMVKRRQVPNIKGCLLYTSPSPRDRTRSRMPSSA